MLRTVIFSILLILLVFRLPATKFSFNIYYPVNAHKLQLSDKNNIKHYLDSLSARNITNISIVGHTDFTADSLYNIKLSARRTKAVHAYLEQLGFNGLLITTGYHGENKPVAKEKTLAANQRNRRCEVTIHYTEKHEPAFKNACNLPQKTIITPQGKQLVFDACEYETLKNCIDIIEKPNYNDLKKGVIVFHNKACKMPPEGLLQINLLDGCSPNACFKNPIKVRFPVTNYQQGCTSWALFNGERMPLTLVEIHGKQFLELQIPCPTSWIKCNCKKKQKQ